MKRTPGMQKDVDAIYKKISGKTLTQHLNDNTCWGCGQDVLKKGFRDELSVKEYTISALCQKCQDITFEEPEEDEVFKTIKE
jgi:hypothetical protein